MNMARLSAWTWWTLCGVAACQREPIELADTGTDTDIESDGGDGDDAGGSGERDVSGSDGVGDETSGDPLPACGDGIVDPDEACDDANAVDGDGCNADCRPSGELLFVGELDAGEHGGFFPHRAVVGADDAVTIAGMDTAAAALFVARWDAAGALRFAVTLEHEPEAVPVVGGIVVRTDGSVRVVAQEVTRSFVHALDSDGAVTSVTQIGGTGASVSTLVPAAEGGWWAVGRREDGRVFAELHDGDDEIVKVVVTDLVAFPRDAQATGDAIVVLADPDSGPQPKLLSISAAGGVAEEVVDVTCGGGLSLTSSGLRVVTSPQWSGGPVDGPCVLSPDGTPAASPWSAPLVAGTIDLAVGPTDRLVAVGNLPNDRIVVQSQLPDGGAGWSSEHTTGGDYLLPFEVTVGASGRIAVPAVSLPRTGGADAALFVFAP